MTTSNPMMSTTAVSPGANRSLPTCSRPVVHASIVCLLLALSVGCDKSGGGDKPATSASASPSAAPLAASSSPPLDASATTAPKATSLGNAASYSGTYSVAPGKLYIPETKDYASVKQAKDEPTKHVGEGALTLDVGPDGRVAGTIDSGPLSPALIDGSLMSGELRCTVRRKDPKDDGLTGTLVAKIGGGGAEGTLSLAEANAAIVREGKLSLKKK